MNIKELLRKQKKLAPGHRTCAGCAIPILVRTILAASDKPVVVCAATGCLEVTTTIYPYTSWKCPFIHSAFENAASTMSGVTRAYEALKKKGKMKKDVNFVVFGGDGGTSDIGLQALSGALERNENFVYVQYDNEGYMNTGHQRSSATPYGAATTTTPVGRVEQGKKVFRKDITKIVAAHNIPYVAQAAVHNWSDLLMKAQKAFKAKGPAFINIFSPCPENWKYPNNLTVEISKLAVNSNFWPLYEVENGIFKMNFIPSNPVPIEKFLRLQTRFKYLFDNPTHKKTLETIQEHIDSDWKKLLELCHEKQPTFTNYGTD
ncbi:MAG: thiamine pyrophosphate-dependent enzyme [archaeon]